MKTFDPQVVVTGTLKPAEGGKSEIIVFTVPLALFELVCIVNIPPEGETNAPCYIKFKVKRKDKERNGFAVPHFSEHGHDYDQDQDSAG